MIELKLFKIRILILILRLISFIESQTCPPLLSDVENSDLDDSESLPIHRSDEEKLSTIQPKQIFDKISFVVQIMQIISVIVTFGIISPPIAVFWVNSFDVTYIHASHFNWSCLSVSSEFDIGILHEVHCK